MFFWKLRHETLDIIAAEMALGINIWDRQPEGKDALNASDRCVKKGGTETRERDTGNSGEMS